MELHTVRKFIEPSNVWRAQTKSKTSYVNFQRTKLDNADLREISGHSLYRYGPKLRASFL